MCRLSLHEYTHRKAFVYSYRIAYSRTSEHSNDSASSETVQAPAAGKQTLPCGDRSGGKRSGQKKDGAGRLSVSLGCKPGVTGIRGEVDHVCLVYTTTHSHMHIEI